MADSHRIDDLRRRVQKDPASIAFAQLAEECRRAGQFQESVDVCRAGLAIQPGYLSARVTLGRALIELNELDTALTELTTVLKSAPENLAAIRGVAEIHDRRGELSEALAQYRAALALAKNDPDLQRTVAELARKVEPLPPPASADGLSFEQMQSEFLKLAPPPAKPATATQAAPPPSVAPPVAAADKDTKAGPPSAARDTKDTDTKVTEDVAPWEAAPFSAAELAEFTQPLTDTAIPAYDHASGEAAFVSSIDSAAEGRQASVSLSETATPPAATELLTIAALERLLNAIHGARAQRGA